MKFEYKLSQVHPNVFVVDIDNTYDLGMIFLRVQEFYESGNEKFRGQEFTLLSYMDWYAKDYSAEEGFTYGGDFSGYNVPSVAIERCYTVNSERTPYDQLLLDIHQTILDLGVYRYYLLGVSSTSEDDVLDHELAHALFYLDDKYRETMITLVELLPFKDELFKFLKDEFEYSEGVHVDETQAYMATGLSEDFEERVKEYEPFREPFQKVFAEWRAEFHEPLTLITKTVDFFDNTHI